MQYSGLDRSTSPSSRRISPGVVHKYFDSLLVEWIDETPSQRKKVGFQFRASALGILIHLAVAQLCWRSDQPKVLRTGNYFLWWSPGNGKDQN